jgi:DNA repair protein RecO (recombination protein O)
MIVATDAIVLRAMKYRDTSKILRLYTRDMGKVSVLAKGARDRKSKFGASLEPMSVVRSVFYWKASRELHLLSQCDLLLPLPHLSDDLHRMRGGMAIIELLDAASPAEEKNETLFALGRTALHLVNNATKRPENALYLFEMSLLDNVGFRPILHRCVSCGESFDDGRRIARGVELDAARGGFLCAGCVGGRGEALRISGAAVKILQRLQETQVPETAMRIAMSEALASVVHGTLRAFLLHHIDSLKPSKSEAVFAGLL